MFWRNILPASLTIRGGGEQEEELKDKIQI
jgi:hypothetical protein